MNKHKFDCKRILERSAEYVDLTLEGNKLEINYDAYSCDSSFNEFIRICYCPYCGIKLEANPDEE